FLRFSPWQPRSGAIRDNNPSRVLPSPLALAGRRPFTGACFPHTSNQRWWLNEYVTNIFAGRSRRRPKVIQIEVAASSTRPARVWPTLDRRRSARQVAG